MTTAILPIPETGRRASTLADVTCYVRPGQHVLVTEVPWEDYEQLLAWRDENRPRSCRLAYDSGSLEIMVVTNLHERLRRVLDLMLTVWITETGGDYVPSGHAQT